MLKLNNINTYYGSLHILKDISLEIQDGEFVTIVGSNGAGKTTLLRTISGFVPHATGHIEYNGNALDRISPQNVVKLGITQIPEGRQLFAIMTVKENLEMGAYLRNDKENIERDLERMCEFFPILKEKWKQQAGNLSGGQQQMLAIARGLMASPKLLLVDEPSFGLAPKVVSEVAEILKQIRLNGISILLVEQNANIALHIADRGYVLELGQIIMQGTGEELLHDDGVKKAYLGISD